MSAVRGKVQVVRVHVAQGIQQRIEELTDGEGRLRWRAAYRAWGNTVQEHWEAADLDGRALALNATEHAAPIEQNLRYQGQYLDRDTGLHYNTFRYYDPYVGRFISPDPIGLEGSFNLYEYAPKPIAWIDPWGWINRNANSAKGRYELYAMYESENPGVKILKIGGSSGESVGGFRSLRRPGGSMIGAWRCAFAE